MTEVPERQSLVAKVAEILRKEMRAGHWQDCLPSERYLSDHLQISRSTLRAALDVLRREKLIEVHHKRHWIGKGTPVTPAARADSRVIVWLTSEPSHELPSYKMIQLDDLRRHLHSAGYALEVHGDPRLKAQHSAKLLENLVRLKRAACWILNMATASVQRWFANSGVPVIVAGSRHEGVNLPALDFDYRAISQHAAGLFRGMGHGRVGLVVPRSNLVGDRLMEDGFREGFGDTGEVVMAGHDGSVKGICLALDKLFGSGKSPTGLFVSHADHALTVISHLSHRHIRVPEEVSLISRHHDVFLDAMSPAIACYEYSLRQYAVRIARMAVQLANAGTLPARQFLIMGKYRKGGSLTAPQTM